jgi:hypothetical protein
MAERWCFRESADEENIKLRVDWREPIRGLRQRNQNEKTIEKEHSVCVYTNVVWSTCYDSC